MNDSNTDPDSSTENSEAKPSISPGTKPKFKVTQSPFSPSLDSDTSAEADSEKPKPTAPKPSGLKPSALSPADAVQPARSSGVSTATAKSTGPEPDITFDDEDETPSTGSGDYVAIGLQIVGAIAAIVFTVLAVMENLPFL